LGDTLKGSTVAVLSTLIIVIGISVAAYIVTHNTGTRSGVWQIATQFSNKGRQDTTEFSMSNPWRVVWRIDSYSQNLFVVAIYEKNNTGYSVVAEADAEDTNSTQGVFAPAEYSGSFIIRVVTMDDTEWTLQIQEFTAPD
jgi:hypothetical protein